MKADVGSSGRLLAAVGLATCVLGCSSRAPVHGIAEVAREEPPAPPATEEESAATPASPPEIEPAEACAPEGCAAGQRCEASECRALRSPLAVSHSHVCWIADEGRVRCWGDNENGQLGDGTRRDRHDRSVEVRDVRGAVQLVTSYRRTCALLADASVRCWGDPPRARRVPELDGVVQIAGTCALRPNGTVICETGEGWADLPGLSDARELAGDSSHERGCAIARGARVFCWGTNMNGEAGAGTRAADWHPPVEVTGVRGARRIAVGRGFSCALRAGRVWCWGSNEGWQIRGISDAEATRLYEAGRFDAITAVGEPVLTPAVLEELEGVEALSTGAEHLCVAVSGGLRCRGRAGPGALGGLPDCAWTLHLYGAEPAARCANDRGRRADVVGAEGVRSFASYEATTCTLDAHGAVRCWGMQPWTMAHLGLPDFLGLHADGRVEREPSRFVVTLPDVPIGSLIPAPTLADPAR